jgi:hypothetical protein
MPLFTLAAAAAAAHSLLPPEVDHFQLPSTALGWPQSCRTLLLLLPLA